MLFVLIILFSRFQEALVWSPFSIYFKKKSIFPGLLEKYSDFGGRDLTIAANGKTVFVKFQEQEDGQLIPNGGIDIAICDIMAKKLNFT